MDYAFLKEVLQGVINSESKEYPAELDRVIEDTAQSGIVRFSWNLLKPLFRARLQRVLDCGFEGQECTDDEGLCDHLLDQLDKFDNPPFTIQRVCELIVEPRKHYKKIGAYMRAMERNLRVVSTQEPDLTWMKSPRLTQLLKEPVSGTSKENSNWNEQNSINGNERVSTKNSDSTPENNKNLSTDGSVPPSIPVAELNGQEQQMDFESNVARINRKRKSCDRDDIDEVASLSQKDEETRTVLQEADSTTTTDTDQEDTSMDLGAPINTDDSDDLENVAKRLKPSPAEVPFPQEEPSSGELPEGVKSDGLVSSVLGMSEQVQNESTGQSELILNVGSDDN